jgi:hypothetical protein
MTADLYTYPVTRKSRSKAHATKRLADADAQLAEALPLGYVDALAATSEELAVTGPAEGPRVSRATGETLPSAQELAAIRWSNLRRSFAERRALLADALDVGQVAQLLSVTRQTPHDRVKAGTLLAVRENGKLLFPLWQFDPDGPDGVLEGLAEVLGALRGRPISHVAAVRWFVTGKAQLPGGASPLERLRAGAVSEVVAEAQAIGAS